MTNFRLKDNFEIKLRTKNLKVRHAAFGSYSEYFDC